MFPSRRKLILAFALTLVSAVEGNAQKLPPATRAKISKILTEAATALAALGGGMEAFAKGVEALGNSWNKLSTSRKHDRLIDISARTNTLANDYTVISSIDDYLKKNNPTAADWFAVTQPLDPVVSQLKALLDELRSDRSEFVLQPGYTHLVQVQAALSQLLTIPPPTTVEDRHRLSEIREEYKENFPAAVRKLNEYISGSH
jgi:hypothetical protein